MPKFFLLRRFHSLTGFYFFLFLIWHTAVNARSLSPNGIFAYNAALAGIRDTPFLNLLEIVFLYIPFLFHFGYGAIIHKEGKSNVFQYPSRGNISYLLQKFASPIAFIFIAVHIYSTRIESFMSGSQMEYLSMVRLFEREWAYPFYTVGLAGSFFYFAQSAWSFLVRWGLTVSQKSQRGAWILLMGLACLMAGVNFLSAANFTYHTRLAPVWINALLGTVKGYLFR